ncbi:PAS domain-containing protein [Dyella sp. Tek66A03]|uniref:PAS domain-containing protein n=1 Tax=Dyella sp. Tek66A03 TaxID=3458298 RepID=UPI00403E47B8
MDNELSRVVDVLPGLVWTTHPDGHVDYVNQGWCDYTGNAPGACHGQAWLDSVHPDDHPRLLDRWQAILASGVPRDMHARLRRADGDYRRFLLRVRSLKEATGTISKWCGVATDIEDCEPVEHNGHVDEAGLLRFIDALPALVCLMTPEGALEHVNRQVVEYLGATLDELKAWPVGDTVHPRDLPDVIARWMHSVRTGEPYDIEHRIRRADGAYHWFQVRGLPLQNSAGRIMRWCVLQMDIDEQKRHKIQQDGENRLLEMVVREDCASNILDALCQLAEDTVGDCYASVAVMDAGGTYLKLAAAPHLPAGFRDTIVDVPVHADTEPSAMAIRLNQHIIVADLATETRWAANRWHNQAMSHGLRSCWAIPITTASGTTLGVLSLYGDHPRSPTLPEMPLIKRMGHMGSINIERWNSQVALAEALNEIRQSEDRLRAMIDTVPGFVWRSAPDGGVEFLNQRWCDYTGISLEKSLGTGWTSRIHPEDALSLVTYWQALLGTTASGSFEARLRRFDGSYRWFLIRAVPVLDETGRVVKWYGQNADIDDRKRAEMVLEGEKHLLGLMAGNTPLSEVLEALCKLVHETFDDALCSVVLTDPRHERLQQGVSPRLLPGAAPDFPERLLEEIDGRPLEPDSSPVASSATGGEPAFSSDLEREHRWSSWCAMARSHGIRASYSTPIKSSCGTVIGVLSILHRQAKSTTSAQQSLIAQFTHLASIAIERARAMAALKQSEAFLAKAQQLSSTGALSWCVETDDITWSEEIYNIYELDPSLPASFELIDQRLHPEDIAPYHKAFRQHRLDGKDFEHEHRLQMPDGSVKYLHLVAHATRDEEGHLEYIAAVQDVTQRRLSDEALGKLRSELAHVARVTTLGALTASIAHEVNQPLAGIITNASTCLRMLGAEPPNIDGARETARRTIRDGNRASDVIKRLRALFSKKNVTTQGVDLNESAREVIAMLLGELQRNGVILHPDFAEDLPLIRGDRVQLQQVILNLIMNACDAMSDVTDRPRHMRVSTRCDASSQIFLAVADCGNGFDPCDAERLFHAFYTTKSKGMGIGLSVSRSIIEGHGGRLWATLNDDHGATFAFSLPGPAARERGSDTAATGTESNFVPDSSVESC